MKKGHGIEIRHFRQAYVGPEVDSQQLRMIARMKLQHAIQKEIDRRGQGAMIGSIHERVTEDGLEWLQKAAWPKVDGGH